MVSQRLDEFSTASRARVRSAESIWPVVISRIPRCFYLTVIGSFFLFAATADAGECPPEGCQRLERVTVTGVREYEQTEEQASQFYWFFFDFLTLTQLPDTYANTLAALEDTFDVRCLNAAISDSLERVVSTDPGDRRRSAAQLAYDRMAQRVQEGVFGSAWRITFGNLRTITVTYADGGTERFEIRGLVGSVTLQPVAGSLTQGTGQVEAASQNSCPA